MRELPEDAARSEANGAAARDGPAVLQSSDSAVGWPVPDGETLLARACAPYQASDTLARHFSQFKLRMDPVFAIALAKGLLPPRPRILDIGCGQGLLAAWLFAAQRCHPQAWPQGWPPPPSPVSYLGIEWTPADAARAQQALDGLTPWPVEIRQADACVVLRQMVEQRQTGKWDLVVILDMLHYLDYPAQEALLRDALRCLAPGGTVLLRIGDASAGWRARYSRTVDRIVNLVRAGRTTPLYCRPAQQWRQLLREVGLTMREVPLPRDAHGANVLMVGTR
ncbi:bifunctional 2-polyprenyl-6-hydroxyphenol methylase/3-demethylubiquinol 3-O-methyltransferase UbiG [Cupriavidus sp. AU9028]|uniref:class I SAM-dependent methyltransferase n=1 Tax=Cupriavidus sp. AU9028 TaxID=2871157 RepID=UPI001C975948|nr:class I SAM-dependent methyltransferase [Cupriavidus sp. AU9028]MBY4897831.1 class I SAM-dependent methyltransferase [Cupriavidus sp. AU9028]